MAPYIFMEKNGIHIIDLNKTVDGLGQAKAALKNIAKSGRKILFVATKKQAKIVIEDEAKKLNMPFVTERWLGGMLTKPDRTLKNGTWQNKPFLNQGPRAWATLSGIGLFCGGIVYIINN